MLDDGKVLSGDELKSDKVRLFVALPIPVSVKSAFAEVHERLRRSVASGGVRWTTTEQWHITLKFLGWTTAASIPPLRAALVGTVAGASAICLRVRAIGFFPERGVPRVIWAGVEDGSHRLEELYHAVQEASAPFTSEKLETGFASHITLGRAKSVSRSSAEALRKIARGFTEVTFGEWAADAIEVMRSELSSNGAKYSCVARIPLGRLSAPHSV
jgi:2'-5' RNA ligase